MSNDAAAVSPARMMTILVVDDNDPLRLLAGRILRRLGFYVIEAPNGQSALDAIDAGPVDLVLTDVAMRGMDGLKLAAIVRATHPTVRVVFMSGCDHDVGSGRLLLRKPFTLDSLAEAVRKGLLAGPDVVFCGRSI